MSTDYTALTIVDAGRLLASRAISAVELVEATLQRIDQTEPVIHAYALVLADAARMAAIEVDREIARGKYRGPLHGIPIGVKDLCYTRGIPTEAGSRALAGFIPTYDATVVTRLREAGAIIIGKTVTHEFAYGVNVPPTRSPWLRDGYPGGSSAGSGAAVAARSAFGALGTDTGGSIREPATLNGLVGMKPTFGLVSRFGIVPMSQSLDHAGPITRTIEDNAILLQALAGFDARDSGSIDAPPVDYMSALNDGIEGLTIGVERSFFFGSQVQPEVRAAEETVIAELAKHGAKIVDVSMPELGLIETVGVTIMLVDAGANARRILRDHAQELDPTTRIMFELGELVPATHYVTAQRVRRVVRDAARDLYRANALDALISPTAPTTTFPIDIALKVDESGEDPMSASLKYMIPANVLGLPALTFPCGFSSEGLPIGCQLMGRPFAEATVYRLARAYERNHEWAVVMPKFAVAQ
jgi:aspartyl-tRNA(Asn)/glutamyl-tRNA(Gln) amidotransferase subunit A